MTTHVVLILYQLHNVAGVVRERARRAAFDVLLQPVVHPDLLRRHREYHVDSVLLHLQIYLQTHITLSTCCHMLYIYDSSMMRNCYRRLTLGLCCCDNDSKFPIKYLGKSDIKNEYKYIYNYIFFKTAHYTILDFT